MTSVSSPEPPVTSNTVSGSGEEGPQETSEDDTETEAIGIQEEPPSSDEEPGALPTSTESTHGRGKKRK